MGWLSEGDEMGMVVRREGNRLMPKGDGSLEGRKGDGCLKGVDAKGMA